jgi:hypothetical protein
LFFLITADNYDFQTLGYRDPCARAFVGLKFLTSGMARLNDYQSVMSAQRGAAEAAPTSPALVGSTPVDGTPAVTASGVAGAPVAVLAPVTAPSGKSPQLRVQVQAQAGRPASMTLLYI